jgi:PAS domain S-box-containing protein
MTQLIFIIDDEKPICELISELVQKTILDTRAICHTDVESLLADPELKDADLFVVDVSLDHFDGRDLPGLLPEALRHVPILFISGIYQDEELTMLPPDIIFDFAAKPIPAHILANRIRLLLRVGRQRRAQFQATGAGYWKMIYHAPFMAIVLQEDLRIRACNLKLAQTLGFEDPEALVGRSWFDFLSAQTREVIAAIHHSIMCGDLEEYGEFENEIINRNGDTILIKWFNSYLDDERISLSIGIPPRKLLIMREDDIRTYWYDVILRDRKAILAMQSALNVGRVKPNDKDAC